MRVKNYILNKILNFQNDEKGVIAVIVAVSFVGLLLAILALSIDLNRTQTSYSKNYGATDASALATAEWWLKGKVAQVGKTENPIGWQPSQAEFEAFALAMLRENYRIDHQNAQLLEDTFELRTNKRSVPSSRTPGTTVLRHTVQVSACTRVGTPVAQSAERADETRTCTTSTAAFEVGKLENTEVAFALDFTESMFWDGVYQNCFADNEDNPSDTPNSDCPVLRDTKALNLVNTMDYVLDTYFDSGSQSTAYASIIPYTSFVNLYPYSQTMITPDNSVASDTSKFEWTIEEPVNNLSVYFSDDGGVYNHSVNTRNLKWDNNGDFHKGSLETGNGHLNNYYSWSDKQFTPYYTDEQNESFKDLTFQVDVDGDGVLDGTYWAMSRTEDYSYVLDRVPVIENRTKLLNILDTNVTDSASYLPFKNYAELVKSLKGKNTVPDPTKTEWFAISSDADESYRRTECYNGMIAGAADQRVEKEYGTNTHGELAASPVYAKGGRINELHESYPIQPLTNEYGVLKQVVGRLTANTFLYRNTKNLFDLSKVMDRQRSRINRASDVSQMMDTSSFHGLMWAWFTLDNNWTGRWDDKSMHEIFCDDDDAFLETFGGTTCANDGGTSKSTRTNKQLPSRDNFKNIILIADGHDNDGLEAADTKTGRNAGAGLGYVNSCDAYAPIQRIDYTEYTRLCDKIKDQDINIHVILYDFDPLNFLAADNNKNRFKDCATDDSYFENITPSDESGAGIEDTIKEALDRILLGILTEVVPVRLIDNEDA